MLKYVLLLCKTGRVKNRSEKALLWKLAHRASRHFVSNPGISVFLGGTGAAFSPGAYNLSITGCVTWYSHSGNLSLNT